MVNQYGDCKDKHTLLAAMLASTGMRAYPVLMNSSRKLDADMPSPGQFDHVITAIPLGNETLWADTTAEVAPAGLLAPSLRNKKALMIPTAGPAHLETTPAVPPFLSTELVTINATIDDLGKISAHTRMVLRGDAEMYMRMMFRRTPRSNWKDFGRVLSIVGVLVVKLQISRQLISLTSGPHWKLSSTFREMIFSTGRARSSRSSFLFHR